MFSAPCVLCARPAEMSTVQDDGSTVIKCARCGEFALSEELKKAFIISAKLKPFLSAATRQATAAGQTLILKPDNLARLATSHSAAMVTSKIEKFLKYAGRASGTPGAAWILTPDIDYPLFDCSGPTELIAYLNHLTTRMLMTTTQSREGEFVCQLTIDGWEKIEPHVSPGGIPGRCFVAMWLDGSMDDAYRSGIRPAVMECGFEAVWMKEVETNQGITDRILSEIRLAEFVVADFTGQRQSVYFEAGFARGLGRQVIWTCHKNEIEKLHFDTKHLGHVAWADPDELRTKLTNSIRANIIKAA